MFERLSESAQIERYRAAHNRLWYPEGAVEEPEYVLPAPEPEYEWEEVSPVCAWVTKLKQDALHAANRNKRIFICDCIEAVCKRFGIGKKELISARRSRSIARPRQISMYLSKHCTEHSLPEIGRHHGNRDHSTVIHAVRTIEKLIKEDRDFKEDVDELLHGLGGGR